MAPKWASRRGARGALPGRLPGRPGRPGAPGAPPGRGRKFPGFFPTLLFPDFRPPAPGGVPGTGGPRPISTHPVCDASDCPVSVCDASVRTQSATHCPVAPRHAVQLRCMTLCLGDRDVPKHSHLRTGIGGGTETSCRPGSRPAGPNDLRCATARCLGLPTQGCICHWYAGAVARRNHSQVCISVSRESLREAAQHSSGRPSAPGFSTREAQTASQMSPLIRVLGHSSRTRPGGSAPARMRELG